MDAFLGKLTQHATSYAIRSGIAITATYAIEQCSKLIRTVDKKSERNKLRELKERFDTKLSIIGPAIDLIELISARGNTTLESAVALTKDLRWDIQSLGVQVERALNTEQDKLSGKKQRQKHSATQHVNTEAIIESLQKLLLKIEDAVPLINLAITTSGAKLTTQLPPSVSPSRLLQASMLLSEGDHRFSRNPTLPAQIGPTFTLSLYMLFAGHKMRIDNEAQGMRKTTWQEVLHKAKVRLIRLPMLDTGNEDGCASTIFPAQSVSHAYSYHLEIIEDLDDDRIHTLENFEDAPAPYKDVQAAGIRENFPIHQVSKIFYADTGKILNIGSDSETNKPVLLLKRDVEALPPRQMMETSEHRPKGLQDLENYSDENEPECSSDGESDTQEDVDHQLRRESNIPSVRKESSIADHDSSMPERQWRFPPTLDPEWLAFEIYTEAEDDSSEDELLPNENSPSADSAYASGRPSSAADHSSLTALTNKLQSVDLSKSFQVQLAAQSGQEATAHQNSAREQSASAGAYPQIRSSLSLLELLIRLTSLQQFRQESHLGIPDEILTFFLQETATTGADGEERRRLRRDARLKVGFDPYDESPIKQHGEDYQHQPRRQPRSSSRSFDNSPRQDYLPERSTWSPALDSHSIDDTPESWLLRSQENSSQPGSRASSRQKQFESQLQESPVVSRKAARRFEELKSGSRRGNESPLSREMSMETDSSLGTSPATPTFARKPGGKENK